MSNKELSHLEIEEIIKSNENVVIIDVRSYAEYKSNHIYNAINISLDEINLITRTVYYKDTLIFLYCASGLLSDDAKDILIKMGYKNVYNIGGIYNWTKYIYIK